MPETQDIIWGRHPVVEAMEVGGRVRRVIVAQGAAVPDVVDLAKKLHIAVEYAPRERLDQLTRGANHQGVIAAVKPWKYADVDDLLAVAASRNEPPLLVALDSVQDVHNLGSLIRTAEAVGAHGIIIPEHRAAGVTPAVIKTSAGAIEHLQVAQVTNLARTLETLKAKNIWAIGLAGEAKATIEQVDLDRPLVLVVGSEGKGLGRNIRDHCDMLMSLPMRGNINSLNAAIAGSIALYAAWRAREHKPS